MNEDRNHLSDESSMESADTMTGSGSGGEISRRATEASEGPPQPERLPAQIGDYRIVRKIGEGGMGVVYEAEQLHPQRPVALKVILGGVFVTETQVRMFQREAQTLARLKHPNIASIYESGRTEDGQHFFSMELVRGEPLNTFFDKRDREVRLTPEEIRFRISVLRRLCDAVGYAHQRGVIHRDLKPSNILIHPAASSGVTSDSITQEIKILDFGLARITDADVAAPTVITEMGRIQGTLPYMSPEQLRGNPEEIDIRSDVYSLGVLLYEMLAGRRPHDVKNLMVHQAAVVICEKPPKPLAKSWKGTKKVDSDLETIVMKTLEKEPSRRYQSASALSDDLERYLENQPILARPPSAAYQLRKMVSRHRSGFAFGASLLALLAAFAVMMSVQAGRIALERDRANQEAEIASQVSRFLVDIFKVSDPGWSRGEDVTAREVLDKGAETIRFELADQPDVRGRLMGTMAQSYNNLGLYEHGLALADEAYRIHGDLFEGDDPAMADTLQVLAEIQHSKGDYRESERLGRESLEMRRRLFGDEHEEIASSLHLLAVALKAQAEWDEAEAMYREALAIRRAGRSGESPYTVATISSLANLLRTRGELDEAETLAAEAVHLARQHHGELHPTVISSLNNLALVLQERSSTRMPRDCCGRRGIWIGGSTAPSTRR